MCAHSDQSGRTALPWAWKEKLWLGRGWLEASWALEIQPEHQGQVALGSPACLVHSRLPSPCSTCPWFCLPCPEQRCCRAGGSCVVGSGTAWCSGWHRGGGCKDRTQQEHLSSPQPHWGSLPGAFVVSSPVQLWRHRHETPFPISKAFSPSWHHHSLPASMARLSSPAHGSFQRVLLLPDSFRDVRNKRERRSSPLTHLLQGNPTRGKQR